MHTNEDFVSRVLNDGRFLTKDDHISRRHILNIGKNKVTTYVSQKLLDRTLYRESNIFKTINCVEMIKEDIIKCPIIEFRKCKALYRSKHKIQGLIYSRYGSSIILVENLDGTIQFNPSTKSSISNRNKRMFGDLVHSYYIQDDYIYIPEEIELINIVALTLSDKETEEISSCNECDKCKSVWEYNFICPDKLYEPIISETILEIMKIYKSTVADENPNLNNIEKIS